MNERELACDRDKLLSLMISIETARINDVLSVKARTSIVDPPLDEISNSSFFVNTTSLYRRRHPAAWAWHVE
jgi:hypothetical protein